MEPKSKKIKVEESSPSGPFTQAGVYDDEIVLEFEEKNLYVSKNFLCIFSPVFEAMFKNECKEKNEKRVQMTGKSYDDFLEFMLCMHPRIHKDIDEKNVLRIALLANEYLVTAFVTKCKTEMKSIISKAKDKAKSHYSKAGFLQPLRECLKVLKTAISISFTDVSDLSVELIARVGYCLYNDEPYSAAVLGCNESSQTCYNTNNSETYGDVRNECISLFKSIEPEWRYKIISRRLKKINNNDFI